MHRSGRKLAKPLELNEMGSDAMEYFVWYSFGALAGGSVADSTWAN